MTSLTYDYDPYFQLNVDDEKNKREIPCFRIYDEDLSAVAETNENLPDETQERYARIFAAAPDLLAALAAYVNHYDDALTEAEMEIRLRARDAIAKAIGE